MIGFDVILKFIFILGKVWGERYKGNQTVVPYIAYTHTYVMNLSPIELNENPNNNFQTIEK
jgi:hypothetical protein